MDQQSYEDGRTGQASGPNTDTNSYRLGQAARDAGTYDASWETGNQGSESSQPIIAPRATVDGMTFVYMVISPLLFMVYPALGLTILAVFWGTLKLVQWSPLTPGLEFLIALVPVIGSFFLGLKLERQVTKFKIYRFARGLARMLFAFGFSVRLAFGKDDQITPDNVLDLISPDIVLVGIIGAVIAHFLGRWLDGIFFPVTYAPGSAAAKKVQAKELKNPNAITTLSGKVSEIKKIGRKQWSFRIDNHPVIFREGMNPLEVSNGDPVTVAGFSRETFKVLGLLHDRNENLDWATPPKILVVLFSLGAVVIALYIKPAIIGILILGAVLVLFGIRHAKKRRVEKAIDLLGDIKLRKRQAMSVAAGA
ncbi:MAG: hypothetical protein HZB57_02595 [Gammaproteobacteria bacterium]|nr:hypothetical protein [Gammaproteobacteria bacterium]